MSVDWKWRRRAEDGSWVCANTGYVIRRAGGNWVADRSDAEPIPGINVHSKLDIAKAACARDLASRQGDRPRRTRVVESVGCPGKWQAQYWDRHMEQWFDIGDAQADPAQAQARQQQFREDQARLTGGAR